MTITGEHIIGFSSKGNSATFQSLNPATNKANSPTVSEGTGDLIDEAVQLAQKAFIIYKGTSRQSRAKFLRCIAEKLQANSVNIVSTAVTETGLPESRINGELSRTAGQFIAFADYIEKGTYLDARIDTAQPGRTPLPKPDLRSIKSPLGVVGVFGASNFPLAFSAGGGDTASALAAGCTVVVRGHNGHPLTSEWVARSIQEAAKICKIPDGVFSLIQGTDYAISYSLVEHPLVKAIGFTGSTHVGRILFNKAKLRPEPIPFYGELGSINPVVLCPNILTEKMELLAKGLVDSLTVGAGQFCTNPGLIIAIEGEALSTLVNKLVSIGEKKPEQTMLMPKIAKAYQTSIDSLASKTDKQPLHKDTATGLNACRFNLFAVTGTEFIAKEDYQSEVFGPSTLVVRCKDAEELQAVLGQLHGQLTGTIWMNDNDIEIAKVVIENLSQKVGRILFNGFPTGVEVTHAMVHGGPYPASTEPKTTSVGSMAIDRFLRPISYQQTPQELLPTELRDENEEGLLRLVNGLSTTTSI